MISDHHSHNADVVMPGGCCYHFLMSAKVVAPHWSPSSRGNHFILACRPPQQQNQGLHLFSTFASGMYACVQSEINQIQNSGCHIVLAVTWIFFFFFCFSAPVIKRETEKKVRMNAKCQLLENKQLKIVAVRNKWDPNEENFRLLLNRQLNIWNSPCSWIRRVSIIKRSVLYINL
jgi:hypothetical protein